MTFSIEFTQQAKDNLSKLDKSIQIRILKKILQLEGEDLTSRHLKHGLPFFVEEVGGNRIIFETDERNKTKTILFLGDHKQYQKWYSEN